MMTKERLKERLNKKFLRYRGAERDDIFQGLLIIRKYVPLASILRAEHNQIYACSMLELLEAGIWEEQAILLNKLGWFVSEKALTHFV